MLSCAIFMTANYLHEGYRLGGGGYRTHHGCLSARFFVKMLAVIIMRFLTSVNLTNCILLHKYAIKLKKNLPKTHKVLKHFCINYFITMLE